MPSVSSDLLDPEGEFLNDIGDEVDGTFLCVPFIDFQGAYTRCIIDCCILVSFDFPAVFSFEYQELNIHLDMVAWHLLFISFGMNLAPPYITRQSTDTVSLQYSGYGYIRDLQVMIASHVPHDPHWAEMIFFPQI